MGFYTGFITFSVIWWVILFAVLPIGVRVEESTEIGFATSAPKDPMIGRKVLITTLITLPLFLVAKWVIDTNILGI